MSVQTVNQADATPAIIREQPKSEDNRFLQAFARRYSNVMRAYTALKYLVQKMSTHSSLDISMLTIQLNVVNRLAELTNTERKFPLLDEFNKQVQISFGMANKIILNTVELMIRQANGMIQEGYGTAYAFQLLKGAETAVAMFKSNGGTDNLWMAADRADQAMFEMQKQLPGATERENARRAAVAEASKKQAQSKAVREARETAERQEKEHRAQGLIKSITGQGEPTDPNKPLPPSLATAADATEATRNAMRRMPPPGSGKNQKQGKSKDGNKKKSSKGKKKRQNSDK